jgi:cytochrome c peroxidase
MRVVSVISCAVLTAVAGACVDETAFTAEELDTLRELALTPLPSDPSNKFADDSRAAVIGKQFFFDTRFSGSLGPLNDGVSNGSLGYAGETGKVACYLCHDPAQGGTDHRSQPAMTSFAAAYTGRNAPSVLNAAYSDVSRGGWQFWDGRKDSLWSQALGPVESPIEHNGSRLLFAHVIFDFYRGPYEALFGPMPDLTDTVRFPPTGKPGDPSFDGMTMADQDAINRIFSNFGKAIAAYERRLVSTSFEPSGFDQAIAEPERAHDVMTASAIRGAKLFVGKAACNECHRGPTLTDFKFHNIGCPQEGQNVPARDAGRFDGVELVKTDVFNRAGTYSDAVDSSHLMTLQQAEVEVGAFKTPTLRNISRTAPYMHNGVYGDLWDVVDHYNFGGATGSFAGTKEVTIAPLLLNDREMGDLVEFLRSLEDGPPKVSAEFPEGLTAPPALP